MFKESSGTKLAKTGLFLEFAVWREKNPAEKTTLVNRSTPGHTESMRSSLLLLFVLACLPVLPSLAGQTESGLAGIYSDSLEGRTTASGEKYDPNAMTAAADLRLGMRLAVTNPANNRTVTVRVNDNRALPGGRILDLSRAAAQALGLGVDDAVRVEIRALRVDEPDLTRLPPVPPAPPPASAAAVRSTLPPPPETYFQMGAFRTELNAQILAQSLVKRGEVPQIFKHDSLFRVYLIVKETEALALIERLTKAKVGFFQVSKEPVGTSVKLSTD